MAQFLLGAVDQGSQFRITPSTIGSDHTWSFYAQDDYRITPKFTLNVGLRYDMYGWFDDRADHASIFDFNIANPKARYGRARSSILAHRPIPMSARFRPTTGILDRG